MLSSKKIFILEILVFYLLPVILIGINPANLAYRHYLFVFGLIYILAIARYGQATFSEWGLSRRSTNDHSHSLSIATIMITLGTFGLLYFVPQTARTWLIGYDMLSVPLNLRIIFYSLFSVPIQELIFRSYLTWRLLKLKINQRFIFYISIFLFVIGHLSFHSPIMLLISLAMGYTYSKHYLQHRQVFPLILAHAVTGSLLILIRNYFLPY